MNNLSNDVIYRIIEIIIHNNLQNKTIINNLLYVNKQFNKPASSIYNSIHQINISTKIKYKYVLALELLLAGYDYTNIYGIHILNKYFDTNKIIPINNYDIYRTDILYKVELILDFVIINKSKLKKLNILSNYISKHIDPVFLLHK
tara:strand:+ start:21224 stop:21661 length:438 start_codon:yes stop_codon:yes gene_type:complete